MQTKVTTYSVVVTAEYLELNHRHDFLATP
jgi:hypothetical protein